MKISDSKHIFTAAMYAEDSILMTGLHGIGKTEVVREWARENNIYLEPLYLSSQETGDLIGLITLTDGVSTWAQPSWLDRMNKAAANGQHCVLFLDEISRATLDVRQAVMQLVLDKRIHDHHLPVVNDLQTLVIAADNPDNGSYAVESMDPALLDRFLSIDVEVDVEAWLDYARATNVNTIIRSFIAENPNKLYFVPNEGSVCNISATPRSWVKLSKYIDNINNIPNIAHYNIIKGKIGTALAAQFLSFMQNFSKMVGIDNVEKLTSTLLKSTKDVEKIAEDIRELIQDLEVVQKDELVSSLINKYTALEAKDSYPLLCTLYALDFENLAGVLKRYQTTQSDKYLKIAEFDKELNNKKLFLRLISAVK